MLYTNVLALAVLASSAAAAPKVAPKSYFCESSAGKFSIKAEWAQAATSGATLGGFPHNFGGMSGDVENAKGQSKSNTQLKFFGGANAKCNEPKPKLSEYPVMKNGAKYAGRDNGNTLTPARAIFLQGTKELCGVVTHFIEADNQVGSGPFRVCDPA